MAQTYDDFIKGQNFVPPQIAPDFSMSQKIGAAGILGAQESMFLSGSHAASNLFEGYRAKKNGEEPLTEEQLAGISPDMEFREGEYMGQALNRHNYEKNRNVSEIVASQNSVATNFVFGMAGGTLMDSAFMLMPGGAMLQTAKASERALKTGVGFKKAQALVRMADAQAKMPTLRGAFLGATAEQAVEANVVLATSEYTGRDYGAFDAILDMAMGPIIATGMNIPLVAQSRRIARQQGRMAADVRSMETFFTSGEYTEGANLLRKYSEDLDLVAKAEPAVAEALNTPKDQRTPESEALVQDFIDTYIADIAVARAKVETEVDPNKPIAVARGEAEAAIQEKVERIKQKVAERQERRRRSRGAIGPEESAKIQQEIDLDTELLGKKDLTLRETKQVKDRISQNEAKLEDASKPFKVVYAPVTKSLAKVNQDTGEITIDMDKVRADFDNGLAYLKGEDSSKGSAQKHVVFKDIDLVALKEVLGTPERYAEFITKHEEAHVSESTAHYSAEAKKDWMSPEAIAAERAANEYAAKQMGIDWDNLDTRNPSPKPIKEINAAAKKMDEDMGKANKEAAERTVQKEKERAEKVEEGAKRSPQETVQAVLEAQFAPEILSMINKKLDPETGGGKDALELANAIYSTVPNKAEAESMLKLATDLRHIALFKQHSEWVIRRGLVVDPTHTMEDLIREGVFLETDALTTTITEAELDALVAGMSPAKAKRIRAESVDHLKALQASADAFISTQQKNQTLFKELMFLRHKIEKGDMTQQEAKVQLRESLDVYAQSLMARVVNDHNVLVKQDRALKGKNPLQVLKYLKTLLDGRPRRGVALKDSAVESKILAQMQEDQGAISQALISNGLYDIFMGVATVGVGHRSNVDAQALYGDKLRNASDMFWEDLMEAARTQELPESWKGIPALEETFTAFVATNENLRQQLNELGAGIRYKEGFTGLSQRWDERSILRHGEVEWRKDMRSAVDWEATREAHGNVMAVVTDENGRVTEWKEFDQEAFLDDWIAEIKSNDNKDHPSTDIVQSFGKHRSVILHTEAELPMTKKYSGHKSLGLLYMDQIRHRSEMIAVAKSLGTRPLPNFEELMKRHGVDPDASFKDIRDLKGASQTLNTKHLMATVEYLTGSLDNPANKTLARYSKGFRQVSNLAFLPLSGVSAVSDIPMIALTLQQNGMLPMHDMGKFAEAYAAAHARRLGSDEAMRQKLESDGAGLDASLNAASARVALADPSDPNVLGKLNDALFNLNYLNGMTTAGQEAFMDIMTGGLAKQLAAGEMDPLTTQMLEDFGFTAEDISILAESIEDGPDGVARVGPSSIKDKAVSRKTREMLLQLMNEAVMFPDASTQALVRGGLQAGTVAGEAARDAFQYTSFPLGMTRIITRKFMNNYQGTSPWTNHQTGMVQMVAFTGSMLAMGYLATVIKDLLRGREPMNLANMSGMGWERVIAQSGIAGILEPMLAMGQGDVRGSLAPLPTTLISAALKETGSEKVDALRPLYGSSYPVAGPAIAKIIGWAFAESLPELQKMQSNRAKFLDSMYEQRP